MTAPLYARLNEQAPQAKGIVTRAAITLTVALLGIPDDLTAFEYATALDALLSRLGAEDGGPLPTLPEGVQRDDRPIYQRLSAYAPSAARSINEAMLALMLSQGLIQDDDLRVEYANAIRPFWIDLGVGTSEDVDANPEKYPGVMGTPPDLRKQQEIDDLERMYRAS